MSSKVTPKVFANPSLVDLQCRLPHWHTSFFLSNIFPDEMMRQLFRYTLSHEEQCAKSLQSEKLHPMMPTGSTAEGLRLPNELVALRSRKGARIHCADNDNMQCIKGITAGDNMTDFQVKLDCDRVHPGYVKLIVSAEKLRIDTKDPRMVRPVLKDGKLTLYLLKEFMFQREGEKHGPAMSRCDDNTGRSSYVIQRSKFSYQTFHPQDEVACIQSPRWPIVATEWKSRDRKAGWPTPEQIKAVEKLGCHIVPVAHQQTEFPEFEWRFSFSIAEVFLAKSLTTLQRRTYLLFKIVMKKSLGEFSFLSTYHLKTTFFWVCEKIAQDVWTVDTMFSNLLALIDHLKVSLVRHNLPNYFVHENNMINHVPQEIVRSALLKLDFLRRYPLNILHEICAKVWFVHNFGLQHVNKAISCLGSLPQDLYYDFSKNVVPKLLDSFVNGSFQETVETFQIYERLLTARTAPTITDEMSLYASMAQIADTILQNAADWRFMDIAPHLSWNQIQLQAAEVYQAHHVDSTDQNRPEITPQPNQRLAFQKQKEPTSSCQKCQELYHKALKSYTDDQDPVMFTRILCKWANWLYYCHRDGELLDLLKNGIGDVFTLDKFSTFKFDLRYTLHKHLCQEVENDGLFVLFPSKSFACYLLVHCYIRCGQIEEAMAAMNIFKSVLTEVQRLDPKERKETCLQMTRKLMGYCYMSLGDYKNAYQMFDDLLNKTYSQILNKSLVEENAKYCMAQIAKTRIDF